MIHTLMIRLTRFTFVILFPFVAVAVQAQTNAYEEYINKYSDMAVEQMKQYRIPASITLAQGLLESGAGRSTLCRKANNHFGIKCGPGWKGPYFVQDDDYANEHFRAYKNARESYIDHSKFLQKPRYAFLFNYSITDYKSWAHGLKKAGYATNPRYAYLLIDLIERYELHRFDSKKHSRSHKSKDGKHTIEHTVYFCNKNYYIVARKGDTFEKLSEETGVSVRKLVKYNELDKDYQLQDGDIIYLEKKQKKADDVFKGKLIKVLAGESYYTIAQKYGIRLKYLYKMNNLSPDAQIYVGQELFVNR